jgi:SulP family sulfate permease
MLHAVFLLVFLWVAAPLAGYIPLPGLAGVLLLVAANMMERSEIARYLRHLPSGVILIATFGLTLARDLVTGIIAGCALALIFHLFRRIDPDQGQVPH